MEFKNTTDYSDRFIRMMLRWVISEVELPRGTHGKHLLSATFTKCRRSYRGRAGAGRILVRIGPPERFPANVAWCPKYRSEGMTEWLLDRDAVLVHVTAHEVAHIRAARTPAMKNDERTVDAAARFVTQRFIDNRDALMAKWSKAEDVDVLMSPDELFAAMREAAAQRGRMLQEKRAMKAAKMLAQWQRRLKIAKNKVKKYSGRVRRYERIAATNPAPKQEKP